MDKDICNSDDSGLTLLWSKEHTTGKEKKGKCRKHVEQANNKLASRQLAHWEQKEEITVGFVGTSDWQTTTGHQIHWLLSLGKGSWWEINVAECCIAHVYCTVVRHVPQGNTSTSEEAHSLEDAPELLVLSKLLLGAIKWRCCLWPPVDRCRTVFSEACIPIMFF